MFCAKCQKDLSECSCPDIKERLASLKNSPYLAMKWCVKCDNHYSQCRCENPETRGWISVEAFIKTIRESFVGAETVYTTGSCYQFYKILKLIFPQANAYYNSDHVITEIDGRFYDISGAVEKTNHLLMSEHYPNSKVMEIRCDVTQMIEQVGDVLEENHRLRQILNNVNSELI